MFKAIAHWIIAWQLGDTFFWNQIDQQLSENEVEKNLVCKLVNWGDLRMIWKTHVIWCSVGHAAVSSKLWGSI